MGAGARARGRLEPAGLKPAGRVSAYLGLPSGGGLGPASAAGAGVAEAYCGGVMRAPHEQTMLRAGQWIFSRRPQAPQPMYSPAL